MLECDCDEDMAWACSNGGSDDCPCLCHVVRTLKVQIENLERRLGRVERTTGEDEHD